MTIIPSTIKVIAPDGRLTPARRRRLMLDLCLRRARPGTGSGQAFLHRRTAMYPWPDLRPILQDIPWLMVGGVATRAYMPERATQDLDILIRRTDGDAVWEKLQAAGYTRVSELAIPGFIARSPENVELDILYGDEAWLDEALQNPETDAAGYPVIGLPYLVLMKLASARTQDMADLARMLGLAAETHLTQVRDTVRRYIPEALEDLEALIYLGRLEIEHER
ncbi:MAG TPA: hypothetical protein PLH19_13405 [Anaerolineae bacterium]|nr:hypothetical protein [Anaerolineae bacterium]HQH39515.1 hypothetical protein [Anaerolineae bacterium]